MADHLQRIWRSLGRVWQRIFRIFRPQIEAEEIRCYQKGDWVRITSNDLVVYEGLIKEMPEKIRKKFHAFCRTD